MDTGRILVIGAGVNGSVCASGLQNAGIDVTVLARGTRYDEIKKEGIVIVDAFSNKRSVTKVKVIKTLKPDDVYDYVLVIVRRNQISGVLPLLAGNRSQNIVFMGNNLAGSEEYTDALGKGRVMFGFPFAGGRREGDIIKAVTIGSLTAPFGEIDGSITPRLKRLVAIIRQAGFSAEPSTRIMDFLFTHGAGVPLFANLILKHGCDTRALARSPADLGLLVDSMRESLSVLRALGHRIVPGSMRVIEIVPRFVLVVFLRFALASKLAEVGGAYHVSQAPDEMEFLGKELEALVEKSGLSAPAIRMVLAMGEAEH